MQKVLLAFLTILMMTIPLQSKEGFKGRPITSNVWMQSGHTLNQGEFMIGIGPIAAGITDDVQIETNLLLFILQFYNASGKVRVMNNNGNAFSLGISYLHFNMESLIDMGENKFAFDAIQPFASYSTELNKKFTLHLGAIYSYFNSETSISDVEIPTSISGTSVSAGIEYSLSNKTKFLGDLAYDVTFNGIKPGAAVLFGWETFRLKLGLGYYVLEENSFILPVIDLWWRFDI